MKKFLTLFVLLFSVPAAAVDYQAAQQVESYLNNLRSFKADFTQLDPSQKVSGGEFFLKKPGKFRWEYDESNPILILSNGDLMVYHDRELNETTHVPASQTLAGFLAREKISFSEDIKLLEAERGENSVKIVLTQEGKEDEGRLAMYFSTSPVMQLTILEVIDGAGNPTRVLFENPQFDVAIADEKFIFQDPKFKKNVWER